MKAKNHSAQEASIINQSQLRCIAEIAKTEAGIILSEAKKSMISSRLTKRLKYHGLSNFDSYCALLTSPGGRSETRYMISALTTNVTHFFREEHHFDTLRNEVIPQLKEKSCRGGKVRIWSAGCSNGQETFSIAMTLVDAWPAALDNDVRILGTDLDPEMIYKARSAIFSRRQIELIPAPLRAKFLRSTSTESNSFRVDESLRAIVRFNELNLIGHWPMRGLFDIIFCRNVVIYFDTETQEMLWNRFSQSIEHDGWLFIGHSERIPNELSMPFYSVSTTTYRPRQTGTKS